jgi:hypothetical protein
MFWGTAIMPRDRVPLDIAAGLRELAAFVRSSGFAEAARLIDAASVLASKEIDLMHDRLDRGGEQSNPQPGTGSKTPPPGNGRSARRRKR